jgi:hypothetical protein
MHTTKIATESLICVAETPARRMEGAESGLLDDVNFEGNRWIGHTQ